MRDGSHTVCTAVSDCEFQVPLHQCLPTQHLVSVDIIPVLRMRVTVDCPIVEAHSASLVVDRSIFAFAVQ